MYEPFKAQYSGGLITVWRTSQYFIGEPQMAIPLGNGDYIYITKEQAMKFFGLVDPKESNKAPYEQYYGKEQP